MRHEQSRQPKEKPASDGREEVSDLPDFLQDVDAGDIIRID